MLSTEPGYVGDDDALFFRQVHGRRVNAMNERYLLPADEDEIKRFELQHRLFQFIFGGNNYVTPVKGVLKGAEPRRILDLGSGGGSWAIEMADEFCQAEVIGVDLAPIQPKMVPPNCSFELFDVDQGELPYPDNYFDLVHARCIHAGVHDYPRLLREIGRVLRPGGLALLIEFDLRPRASSIRRLPTTVAHSVSRPYSRVALHAPGWFALWDTYSMCLKARRIDVEVPRKLGQLLAASGRFDEIVRDKVDIPVGFHLKDDLTLTIGQLAWMGYDLQLPSMKPLFLSSGIAAWKVDALVQDAQRDLYNPSIHPSSRLYVVHGQKV